MEYVLQVCQFVLTLIEIGMCYAFCDLLIEDKQIKKYEIFIRVIVTLGISGLVYANRVTTCFMNHFLYLLSGIILSWSISFMNRIKFRDIIGIGLVYNSGVGLIHVFFLVLFRIYLKNDEMFSTEIYFKTGILRILILFLAFLSIVLLYVLVKKNQYGVKVLVARIGKSLIVFGVLGWWMIAWATTEIMYLSWTHGFWFLGIFMFVLFTIGISCYLFYYNLKQEMEMQAVQLKNKVMDDYYKDVKLMVENCLYTAHDLKNHIIVLSNYARQNNLSKIETYLDKIGQPVKEFAQYIWCENEVLNLIINTKLQEAKRNSINVEISVEKSKFVVSDNELCTILSNLLDNAIEACKKIEPDLRWICVKICEESGCTIIKVSNSILDVPVKRNESFVSSKGSHHGLGLKSVKTIVHKYNGDVSCSFDERQFNVIISF